MQDLLQQLISDTILYLKDPLLPKGSILSTQEEYTYLKQITPTPPLQPARVEPVILKQPEIIPLVIKHPEPATDIQQTLAKLKTGMRFVDHIPDDSEGKKIGSSWKEKITDADVILLACKQDAETIDFLKTLAKAIDTRLAKSKIIPAQRLEQEKSWDLFLKKNNFRLIVTSEGLDQLKGLMSFYRGTPSQNTHFLDQTPLIPLLAASAYKQLDKKAEVWKTLCQILKE